MKDWPDTFVEGYVHQFKHKDTKFRSAAKAPSVKNTSTLKQDIDITEMTAAEQNLPARIAMYKSPYFTLTLRDYSRNHQANQFHYDRIPYP